MSTNNTSVGTAHADRSASEATTSLELNLTEHELANLDIQSDSVTTNTVQDAKPNTIMPVFAISEYDIKIPSHSLIVGRTQTGKTSLLMNILEKELKHFDYVVLMSGSCMMHHQYDALNILPCTKYDSINVEALECILKFQKTFSQEANDKIIPRPIECLLVIDDIGQFSFYQQTSTSTGGKSIQMFTELFLNGRQYHISVFILSQCESGIIPPTIVQNCSTVFITSSNNAIAEKLYRATKEKSLTQFKDAIFAACKERSQCVLIRSDWMDTPKVFKYHGAV